MGPPLPAPFLAAPLAHRGLHDAAAGRPENSLAAVRAAVAAGYGIEIDVQPSADGEAMVFHDAELARMTGAPGRIDGQTAAALAALPLRGGDGEGVPTLSGVLAAVGGRVPLLIEVKDQAGDGGRGIGPLEAAVARSLAGYAGPVAVMSFNPDSVAAIAALRPEVPRGLTTCAFTAADMPGVPEERLARLRAIADAGRVGASFISHDAEDLGRPRVAALKAQGLAVLCWTIRSPEAEARARRIADNVTFEGYAAAIPGRTAA